MEWKSSTDKEKYGDVIGEVIHHTLFEDGTITKYDVKFGNKTIKNIPTDRLNVVEQQEHVHSATEPGETESDEEDETEETFANYDSSGKDTSAPVTKVKTTIKKIT